MGKPNHIVSPPFEQYRDVKRPGHCAPVFLRASIIFECNADYQILLPAIIDISAALHLPNLAAA